jgi:hypothetical protein
MLFATLIDFFSFDIFFRKWLSLTTYICHALAAKHLSKSKTSYQTKIYEHENFNVQFLYDHNFIFSSCKDRDVSILIKLLQNISFLKKSMPQG